MASENVRDISELFGLYGEPCSNCSLWDGGVICIKRHRQKTISIERGHIPEAVVRRRAGCPDHVLKDGHWWHEDPIKPHQSGYGGSSTNILI